MKRILLGITLITLFISCSKSPEDKVSVLIEEDIKKILYHPETYNPAETQVDSAFTPFDDPTFYEKTMQLCRLAMSIDEYDRNMKDAKSSMSIWSGPYQTAYGRNNYQEAKEDYDKNTQNKKNAEKKAKKLVIELKNMQDQGRQFIGFKARHRYRADNNSGQTFFGEMKYLFDKDINKIIASYDMDDDEYKAVQFIYKQILSKDESVDDKYFDDNKVFEKTK